MDELRIMKNNFSSINFMKLSLLLTVLFLVVSCATTSRTVSSKKMQHKELNITQKKIVIMPIILRYVSMSRETELPHATYRGDEIGNFLMDQAIEILKNKGFEVLGKTALYSEGSRLKTAYDELIKRRQDLFKSTFDSELLDDLKVLSQSSNNTNILVFMIYVKVGPGAYWDPVFTGAIASASSYTRLKVVLINSNGGRSLWKNEVQLREIPKLKSSNYKKSIQVLLNNLKYYDGGGNV